MIRYEFKDNHGKNWVRISKSEARKLYDRGEKVCFCPCKMRPFGYWNHEIIKERDERYTFDRYVDYYEMYNCNSETGKYTSFYKMEV